MQVGCTLRVSLSISGKVRIRVLPLLENGPPLDLERSSVTQWQAEALETREMATDTHASEAAGSQIGHLVELLVWSDAGTRYAWAKATLAPVFSLTITEKTESDAIDMNGMMLSMKT